MITSEEFKAIFEENKILLDMNEELINEINFLKQRNTDLRKKSWINVYDENLMLIEEHKTLVKTIDQMRNELIQMGQLAEKFHLEANNLKQENEKLKGVLKSVETFIGQYTIR